MQHAIYDDNAALIQALERVQGALLEAVDTIDELGGGSESTYDNLDTCQAAIEREIAALILVDAPSTSGECGFGKSRLVAGCNYPNASGLQP